MSRPLTTAIFSESKPMSIVILKNVRVSYPDFWQPGKPPVGAKPGTQGKFGGQFIFAPDSDADKTAKAAFMAAAQETFGQNWQAILGAMEKSKKCLRKGDENLTKDGAIRDGYAGNNYIVARNKVQPLFIGPARTKPAGTNGLIEGRQYSDGFPVLTQADGKPYGGCYVNLKVNIKAMKAFEQVPNQVYAELLTVQFAGDGTAFGSAPGTSEGFDEVEGAASIGDSDTSFDPMA